LKTKNLLTAVKRLVEERKDYYKEWIFDQPVVVSQSHNKTLERIQKVLFRLINHFVSNYDQYEHLMPVSPRIKQIIELAKTNDYEVGTYRTDFVYDQKDQVRLLEITCRCAVNGFFLTAITESISKDLLKESGVDVELDDLYSSIFDYISKLMKGSKRVIVLTGRDKKNESKIFIPIFESMGLTVISLDSSQINDSTHLFKDSFIISELALEEIIELSETTISKLMASNLINDLRTVFLIHDKRFFSVLYNEEFRKDVLNEEDNYFFSQFLIPTFSHRQNKEAWSDAERNKNSWVLKHATLGKSQGVYAGIVTTSKEWQALFDKDLSHMVIQKWIDTDKVNGSIDGVAFEDYITGTLLFFNDHFFGLAAFRLSSFPVTNKKDDRKACTFTLSAEMNEDLPCLKYLSK
jgi:hypothetical protein